MEKYIITEDNYITNTVVDKPLTLKSNQNAYKLGSITGSSIIDSKYDDATDSFIAPIKITQIECDSIITGSLFPFTASFSSNIDPSSSIEVFVDNGYISSSNIDNNHLYLLVGHFLDQTPNSDIQEIKVNIDQSQMEFIAENPRITPPYINTHKVLYSGSL